MYHIGHRRILFELKSIFQRAENFLIKIFIVFPTGTLFSEKKERDLLSILSYHLVFRLTTLIFVLLYFYANLASELFNSSREKTAASEFIEHRYFSYDTLAGSMLALIQIIFEQQ